jgi:hypothetical protein
MDPDGNRCRLGVNRRGFDPITSAAIPGHEDSDIAAKGAEGGRKSFGNIGQTAGFGIRGHFGSTEKDAQIIHGHALSFGPVRRIKPLSEGNIELHSSRQETGSSGLVVNHSATVKADARVRGHHAATAS